MFTKKHLWFLALFLLIIGVSFIPIATVTIKLDLPPSLPLTKKATTPIFIDLREPNVYYIGSRKTSLKSLDTELHVFDDLQHHCTKRIFIKASPKVSYEEFMLVLNKVQSHGCTKIGLINKDIE